jgi:hypothetical protein
MLVSNQLSLERVVARGNLVDGGGVLSTASEEYPPEVVEPFVVRDSVFVDNTFLAPPFFADLCCPVVGFADAEAEVSGTTIAGNEGGRFALAGHTQDVEPQDLTVENSTIADNTSAVGPHNSFAIRATGDLTLRHTTVSGNQQAQGAAVQAATLDVTGSLVGDEGDACDISGATTSHGGNVDTDGTCGFGAADDRPNEADLGLVAPELTAAMPVLALEPTSPAVDLATSPTCGDLLPLDQLGYERPSGPGCDAGSAELQQPFSDVPPSHPFFEDIGWAASEGIAGGFPDGTYRPSLRVSRQAMAAFLYRLAGEPDVSVPSPQTFSDVGATHPFFTEIEWLAGDGIAGGFGDGTFRPSVAVSRQATAAFLYRWSGEPPFTAPSPPTFDDVGLANPFRTEIEWLVQEGIADGYEDGTFRPGVAVSRQAMAAFLHRLASD